MLHLSEMQAFPWGKMQEKTSPSHITSLKIDQQSKLSVRLADSKASSSSSLLSFPSTPPRPNTHNFDSEPGQPFTLKAASITHTHSVEQCLHSNPHMVGPTQLVPTGNTLAWILESGFIVGISRCSLEFGQSTRVGTC